MTTPQLGFCMKGSEQAFIDALTTAARSCQVPTFVYCEIGLGHLQTFTAVFNYLDSFGIPFRMIGVDLQEWQNPDPRNDERFSFHLSGSRSFFEHSKEWLSFIFIDGCHSYNCFTADFLGAESCLLCGGVVCIHDVDPACQGTGAQYHCNGEKIGVRRACQDLGLITLTRPGWKLIQETPGTEDNSGRGCLFLQKI